MRIDDDARFPIFWDAEVTFDPAATTVVLEIQTSPTVTTVPTSWVAAATVSGTAPNQVWKRTAKTDSMLAGSSVGQAGDVRPAKGRYVSQFIIIVTADGQRIPGTTFTLDVK